MLSEHTGLVLAWIAVIGALIACAIVFATGGLYIGF